MKFLVDQNVPRRLADHLREQAHDVTVMAKDYPHSLPDETVLSIVTTEDRIVITLDRDFGELIFHRKLARAGVIYLRGMDRLTTPTIISRLTHQRPRPHRGQTTSSPSQPLDLPPATIKYKE